MPSSRTEPTGHILVCISEDPASTAMIRQGLDLALREHSPWTVLYVETNRHARLREAQRDAIADSLRLAERLGADVVTVPGDRIATAIVDFAASNSVTQIVIGKSRRSRWFELRHGSIVRDIVRKATGISVHVVVNEPTLGAHQARDRPRAAAPRWSDLMGIGATVGLLVIATVFGASLRSYMTTANFTMMYLTVVLLVAVAFGLVPSLIAAVLAAVCLDFFFIPPVYTFGITQPSDISAMLFFVVVATLISSLAARTRTQALMARNRAKITGELYRFTRKLAEVEGLEELLQVVVDQTAAVFGARVTILLHDQGRLSVRAGHPHRDDITGASLAAATEGWRTNRQTGHDTGDNFRTDWRFIPLATGRSVLGVLGIVRDSSSKSLTADESRLLRTLADQIAMAIERMTMAAEIDRTRVLRESERLRTALLTSISHDLRTPLTSVLGTLTSLRSYDASYDPETRAALLDTAQEEAERLNRFVNNLLDITRLESDALEINRDPVEIVEVVRSAARRAEKLCGTRKIAIAIPDDLPMVSLDFVLVEQALFNLLDNAAKYAPGDSTITIKVHVSGSNIVIQVMDEGPGIPVEELERIFEKFHRVKAADRTIAGTGLGLLICRGFIEAHGGTVGAGNRTDRQGAVFSVTLPIESRVSSASEESVSALH